MRRLLIAVLAFGLTLAAPAEPAEAVVPGAVAWTVDHQAKTITAHVQIQIYPGCSGNPYGEEDEQARACLGVSSQVTQFLADKIKHQSEGVWNRGYYYRCYKFVLSVDVKLAPDDGHLDGDRIGVMIDPSFAGIRDHVGNDTGNSSDWDSNDPSASPTPTHTGSAWGEQSQLEATTYAHEVGHILGLDDAYHDVRDANGRTTSVPNDGAPLDLMSTMATNIDQSTINRVVERNRNSLRDKAGRSVSLDDLECPEFMATIDGKQTDHVGIKFKYTTDAVPCGGGGTVSKSEDQDVVMTSGSVHVDAVKLADPSPSWPGLETILVPHGQQAAQINLAGGPSDQPTLFTIPAQFSVDRSNASPGVGPMPAILDLGYSPCAGGGGGGQAPPSDCGHRDFTATVAVTLTGVTVILPQVEKGSPDPSSLYNNCSGPDPIPGLFAISGGGMIRGGAVPVAKLLDPTVDKIDISGSATFARQVLGRWETTQYDWLIILCRIRHGVPAC